MDYFIQVIWILVWPITVFISYMTIKWVLDNYKHKFEEEETDIMKFLDLLLKGEITVDHYLRYKNVISSENMISKVEPIKKAEPIKKEVKIDRSSEKPKETKLKYCIKCGAEIKPNTRFCINCGASVKLT